MRHHERNCAIANRRIVDGKTLEAVAQEFDIARERVRQIVGQVARSHSTEIAWKISPSWRQEQLAFVQFIDRESVKMLSVYGILTGNDLHREWETHGMDRLRGNMKRHFGEKEGVSRAVCMALLSYLSCGWANDEQTLGYVEDAF